MTTYRPDQPPVPRRMAHRPVERGYAVPWFCAEIDGHYDFRVVGPGKVRAAITQRLCWLCGQPLGAFKAFCIGPMCAINRTIGDPPSHRECAEWAIRACPFLNQRETKRRTTGMPEGATPPAGYGIMRQPGATCLWVTKSYAVTKAPGGVLFDIGDPVEVAWYCQGRPASRSEVMESITTGYPILLEMAEQEGPAAVTELERLRDRALTLLPSA